MGVGVVVVAWSLCFFLSRFVEGLDEKRVSFSRVCVFVEENREITQKGMDREKEAEVCVYV